MQPHQRLVALGQRDRLEHRIDQSFGLVAEPYILAFDDAPARMVHLAVLVDQPPRGSDALHLALAGADAIERLQSAERLFHGRSKAVGHFLENLRIGAGGRVFGL